MEGGGGRCLRRVPPRLLGPLWSTLLHPRVLHLDPNHSAEQLLNSAAVVVDEEGRRRVKEGEGG